MDFPRSAAAPILPFLAPFLATVGLCLLLLHRSESPALVDRYSGEYAILLILCLVNVAFLWRSSLASASSSSKASEPALGVLLLLAAVILSCLYLIDILLGVRVITPSDYVLVLLTVGILKQAGLRSTPCLALGRHPQLTLSAILLTGLLLRLYGIGFGLPYRYDPDEHIFVNIARNILVEHDLNPHWFGHPGSTCIYLLSVLQALLFSAGRALGMLPESPNIRTFFFQDRELVFLSSRLMIAAFGVASIVFAYRVTRRLFDVSTGLLAALLLALSPLHVSYSKLIRTDIQAGLLVLVVLWLCLDVLEQRTWLASCLAGIFTGFALATKYPAGLVALSAGLAHGLNGMQRDRQLSRVLAYGAATVAGLFMASPFLLLDIGSAMADIAKENPDRLLSYTGEGPIRNLVWYLVGPLSNSASGAWLVLAGLGVVLCVFSEQRGRWILASFPLIFLVVIACLRLRMHHWVLPAIPVLCILAAHALRQTASWLGRTRSHRIRSLRASPWPAAVLVIGVVAPLLRAGIHDGRDLSLPDTRTIAGSWIMQNIPAGSRLLVETRTPQLPKERYQFFVERKGRMEDMRALKSAVKEVFSDEEDPLDLVIRPQGHAGKLDDIGAIRTGDVDYMVLTDIAYKRYVAEEDRFPDYGPVIANYEALMGMSSKIYELKPVYGKTRGPTIRVYKFDFVESRKMLIVR